MLILVNKITKNNGATVIVMQIHTVGNAVYNNRNYSE